MFSSRRLENRRRWGSPGGVALQGGPAEADCVLNSCEDFTVTKDKRIAPRKGSWDARFTPSVRSLWRLLQDELRDYGASDKAR
jgi:hypothetical protein